MSALDQAIQRHEQFLALDRSNLSLAMALADLYEEAGRHDQAIAGYEACLAIEPGHAPARSRIASVRLAQQRFDEAERLLRELLGSGETAPALLHNLGLALFFQRRWEEARACFVQADDAGLARPAAFAYWARCLHHLGDLPEAIAVARRWLQLATADERQSAQTYLAQLLVDGGELVEARRLAEAALTNVPGDAQAEVALGFVELFGHQRVAAIARFESALQRERDDARAWQGLGLALLGEHDLPRAITALQQAVERLPDALGSLNALGWALLFSSDFAGAEQTFERAVEVDRNFGESHGGLASAYALQGEREAAERELRLARRLAPGGFGADFAQAVLLAQADRKDDANAVIRSALHRPLPGGGTLLDQLQVQALRSGARMH